MDRKKFIISGVSFLPVAATLVSFIQTKSEFPKEKMDRSNQENVPEFNDARSKKVIFVAHCFLNQNARLNKYACTPAAIDPVIQELLKRGIGIIQLPCPETQILGLGRNSRDIYNQLSEPEARKELKQYANQVMELVTEYRKWDFKVLGVLGNDGSPCCGVTQYYNEGQKPGSGAFIQELKSALAQCEPLVKMAGIQEDKKTEKVIQIINEWDNS